MRTPTTTLSRTLRTRVAILNRYGITVSYATRCIYPDNTIQHAGRRWPVTYKGGEATITPDTKPLTHR